MFEVAGCGAFQVVTATPVLTRHFDPGDEIVTFRTVEQLREVCTRYLRDLDERKRIADCARRRALADHTYLIRMRTVVNTLFERDGI